MHHVGLLLSLLGLGFIYNKNQKYVHIYVIKYLVKNKNMQMC